MAEYGIRQRSQLSRTISNSKSTVELQKNFVDNRGNNAIFSLIQCRQAPVKDNRLPIQMGRKKGKKSNWTSLGPMATPAPTTTHAPATMPPVAALLSDLGKTTNTTSCETKAEKVARITSSGLSLIPGCIDTVLGIFNSCKGFKGKETKYTVIPDNAQLTISNIIDGKVLASSTGAGQNKKKMTGELYIRSCDTEITTGDEFADQITMKKRDLAKGVTGILTSIGGLSTVASGLLGIHGLSLPTSILSCIAPVGYLASNIIRCLKHRAKQRIHP